MWPPQPTAWLIWCATAGAKGCQPIKSGNESFKPRAHGQVVTDSAVGPGFYLCAASSGPAGARSRQRPYRRRALPRARLPPRGVSGSNISARKGPLAIRERLFCAAPAIGDSHWWQVLRIRSAAPVIGDGHYVHIGGDVESPASWVGDVLVSQPRMHVETVTNCRRFVPGWYGLQLAVVTPGGRLASGAPVR